MNREEARKKAQALVAQMTIEERASQLKYDSPAIERLGIPSYNWWSEALHGVARAGTATVFPQAIGMAATFDESLVRAEGDVISTEGRAKYNAFQQENDHDIYKGLTFWSPNINIFRDPRWGRGHETLGEDPCLTSTLGGAFVEGLQGEGEHLKAAACAKHFAVHSGPEATRHEADVIVNDKDLYETYLPAFEHLVKKANVEAVMGAYNRVNGEPCCGSVRLLSDILRKKWDFQGHVVSDCWAIADFHMYHHVTDTAPQSAAMAIKAGCDVNCGVTYLHLLAALKEGLIEEEDITSACVRAMTTRYMLGILGGGSEFDAISPLENDTDEHAALSEHAARESLVLLKNNGVLPLNADKIKTLAVIGPNADSVDALFGNYNGDSSRYTTVLAGARAYLKGKARVLYAKGSPLCGEQAENLSQVKDDRIAEAVSLARRSDAVLLCVGLDHTLEGEQGDAGNADASGDKRDLCLPSCQRRLIKAVLAAGKPVITVVITGSAVSVQEGDAVLCAFYPGQAGGKAIIEAIFGEFSPSGKLPVTFYRDISDLPPFEDYSMKGRTYRYFEKEELYPFGYGLSYTTFDFSDASYEDGAVSVTVRNAGARAGRAVAQVYAKLGSPDSPPNPSLCGFASAELQAGEEARVRIPLWEYALTVVNGKGDRIPANGMLFVGGQSPRAGEKMLEVIV